MLSESGSGRCVLYSDAEVLVKENESQAKRIHEQGEEIERLNNANQLAATEITKQDDRITALELQLSGRTYFHSDAPTMYVCPECSGDGKKTCHNPDHGFIVAVGHEIGRLGCPCCGHDERHKVKNGGSCGTCNGTGKVTESDGEKFLSDMGYDLELEPVPPVFHSDEEVEEICKSLEKEVARLKECDSACGEIHTICGDADIPTGNAVVRVQKIVDRCKELESEVEAFKGRLKAIYSAGYSDVSIMQARTEEAHATGRREGIEGAANSVRSLLTRDENGRAVNIYENSTVYRAIEAIIKAETQGAAIKEQVEDRCTIRGAKHETHDKDHLCRMHRDPETGKGNCTVCNDPYKYCVVGGALCRGRIQGPGGCSIDCPGNKYF